MLGRPRMSLVRQSFPVLSQILCPRGLFGTMRPAWDTARLWTNTRIGALQARLHGHPCRPRCSAANLARNVAGLGLPCGKRVTP
jgi:hypothetical protein